MTNSAQMFKYVLTTGENEVEMPEGGEILGVMLAANGPALAVLVDPGAAFETRHFVVLGNGEDLPDGVSAVHYRGTAKVPGAWTAHVFETTAVQAAA